MSKTIEQIIEEVSRNRFVGLSDQDAEKISYDLSRYGCCTTVHIWDGQKMEVKHVPRHEYLVDRGVAE